MARNPQKVRCSHAGPDGQGCRAWAVRGSEPPLCSTHARGRDGGRSESNRTQCGHGAAAQPGSEEIAVGGFYSPVLRPDELADLATYGGDPSLDHEIACARVALRRVLTLLGAPMPSCGVAGEEAVPADDAVSPLELAPADYARLAGLALQAIRTVAKLMRDRRALSGEAADGFARAIAQALDELS